MIEDIFLTPTQEKRQDFALRLAELLYEMDDLLLTEYNKDNRIATSKHLEELLLRKVHMGGIPYALKINSNGLLEPNDTWVTNGYFKMNLLDREAYRRSRVG